ncbi:GNAT family N-acetyltransferase [Roseivirga sp.]|uniref:GNAT family N-acetyltransferase n=1 Tax=Roseivirga sp. TaxID=1964215 RepID=UPI003B527713
MDIQIKVLGTNQLEEFKQLVAVFEKVFEMKNFSLPKEKHLQQLLNKDNFFPVVALKEHEIVGGLTVYVLDQYYSEKPLAYIFDLAILEEHQRKGIGKQLINFTKNHCRALGYEEVFVQADRVDHHAVNFYRSTQPTEEEDVLHFYYTL